jgi:hypothetical protein
MARYSARFDVLMPVFTGSTSWVEAGMRSSAKALINGQPSGY